MFAALDKSLPYFSGGIVMKNRLIAIISIFLLLMPLFCMMSASVSADNSVSYIDGNGETQQCNEYLPISEYSGVLPMWLVVDQDAALNDRLEITGELNLILVNGKTLTANKGISVNEGAALNIYGQSGNKGKLIANESQIDKCAGIGGDNNQSCGTIEINGGTIISYGGSDAAGIGGGNITISGGTVYGYGSKKNYTEV